MYWVFLIFKYNIYKYLLFTLFIQCLDAYAR